MGANNIALAYSDQERKDEAIEEYKKACELGSQESCNWLKQNGISK